MSGLLTIASDVIKSTSQLGADFQQSANQMCSVFSLSDITPTEATVPPPTEAPKPTVTTLAPALVNEGLPPTTEPKLEIQNQNQEDITPSIDKLPISAGKTLAFSIVVSLFLFTFCVLLSIIYGVNKRKSILQKDGSPFMRRPCLGCRDSLVANKNINILVRGALPILCLFTMGLIASSDYSYAMTLDVGITLLNKDIEVKGIYALSIATVIQMFMDMNILALALPLLLFTGIWPFIKLAILLLVWLGPSFAISQTYKGRLLNFLALLGKWNFTELFVIVTAVVFFNFKINSPHLSLLDINGVPTNYLSLDFNLVPQWVSFCLSIFSLYWFPTY